jgi:long-chain acyl-CoA synthetase
MRAHLATLLDDFRRHGRQIAVVRHQGVRRHVASYSRIAQMAARFAALLEEQKIGPGERVLLWAANSAAWIAAFHGCLMRGVLAVPLDAAGSAHFAARVAADVRPRLAVGDAALLAQLPADAPLDFPRLAFENWPDSLPAREAAPVEGLNHATPLQILFTSGTTGDPKGVVLTHGNVLASISPIEEGAQPYLRYERLVHPLRFLHTLPLSHVFGQTMGLWIPPIFAAQVHFEDRLVASRLIETIHQEKISVLAAVPRVHALLKNHLEAEDPTLGARLRAAQGLKAQQRWWRFRRIHRQFGLKFWALISGGGALPGPVEEFWNTLGFAVIQGYGMTESSALITLNHPFHIARGSIGRPMPGREVKLGPDGEVLVRGAMISAATWSSGSMQRREDEWLATGDLAESSASGELRFLGRKSEVIVTSAGMNLHPEDLEAALEAQPGVNACCVLSFQAPSGPEPFAVLAMRGPAGLAPRAIEQANAQLADFQRIRRWALWPDPDLPRTGTGKIRRRAAEEWLNDLHRAARSPVSARAVAASDWLVEMICKISGEPSPGIGDELRLGEDFLLDSLGFVQLEAALSSRLGLHLGADFLDRIRTLGELRDLLQQQSAALTPAEEAPQEAASTALSLPDEAVQSPPPPQQRPLSPESDAHPAGTQFLYPRWPWSGPVRWLRNAFLELFVRPLVCILAAPRVHRPALEKKSAPLLVVANHVTAFDGALIQYALPGFLRRRLAVAMAGEMLEDYRHFRNPEAGKRTFLLTGPLIWLLLTALFNVFPLPRRRDFQRSFLHAGQALDRGLNVLIFPEGSRSATGDLAAFRPGIGLLVKETGAPVLPLALCGLGVMKTGDRRWFRSGKLEIRLGEPIRFPASMSEAAIATQLHEAVAQLVKNRD